MSNAVFLGLCYGISLLNCICAVYNIRVFYKNRKELAILKAIFNKAREMDACHIHITRGSGGGHVFTCHTDEVGVKH